VVFFIGGVFLLKLGLFLNKFPENFSNEFCSDGQKGKGLGEGILRLRSGQVFCPLSLSPLPNFPFRFAKCAAKKSFYFYKSF